HDQIDEQSGGDSLLPCEPQRAHRRHEKRRLDHPFSIEAIRNPAPSKGSNQAADLNQGEKERAIGDADIKIVNKVGHDINFIDVLAATGGAGHENQRDEKNVFVFEAGFVSLPALRDEARFGLVLIGVPQAVAKYETDHAHQDRKAAHRPKDAAPTEIGNQ